MNMNVCGQRYDDGDVNVRERVCETYELLLLESSMIEGERERDRGTINLGR